MSADGSTLLTEGAAPAGNVGNPAAAPASPAEAALQAVHDGPPEYIPPKFWDPEKKAPKVEDLGKSYMNLEKLLGREKVPVPLGDDDEEGWQRWYAASGRPEKPDDYEFQRPDKLPDGMTYDEDTEKNFRMWAHANGINKRQATKLYDGFVKTQIERQAAWQGVQQQAKTQALDVMRREFGNQFDAKMQMAKSAMSKYADPDYLKFLDESGRGNDPREIWAWIKVGEELAGDERLKGKPQLQTTPLDAQRAISEFRSKNDKALMDKSHPQHEALVLEMNRLFQAAYPE